jgi:hypothetical protein
MHWLDPDYLPETAGIVAQFLINPHGEIDGIILKDGTEIHLPPHLSPQIGKAIAVGEKIKVRGVRPRGVHMISAIAIESAKGVKIIDNGPPDDHRHGKDARKARAKDDAKPAEVAGIVRRALHGPKGEVRGVLLEDGTAIRFPKHEAARLKSLTKEGSKFAARGHARTSDFGTLMEAREIGTSAKTRKPIGPKPPKPEKPGKHHHAHHPH